jgi:hypothetical protein
VSPPALVPLALLRSGLVPTFPCVGLAAPALSVVLLVPELLAPAPPAPLPVVPLPFSDALAPLELLDVPDPLLRSLRVTVPEGVLAEALDDADEVPVPVPLAEPEPDDRSDDEAPDPDVPPSIRLTAGLAVSSIRPPTRTKFSPSEPASAKLSCWLYFPWKLRCSAATASLSRCLPWSCS